MNVALDCASSITKPEDLKVSKIFCVLLPFNKRPLAWNHIEGFSKADNCLSYSTCLVVEKKVVSSAYKMVSVGL